MNSLRTPVVIAALDRLVRFLEGDKPPKRLLAGRLANGIRVPSDDKNDEKRDWRKTLDALIVLRDERRRLPEFVAKALTMLLDLDGYHTFERGLIFDAGLAIEKAWTFHPERIERAGEMLRAGLREMESGSSTTKSGRLSIKATPKDAPTSGTAAKEKYVPTEKRYGILKAIFDCGPIHLPAVATAATCKLRCVNMAVRHFRERLRFVKKLGGSGYIVVPKQRTQVQKLLKLWERDLGL